MLPNVVIFLNTSGAYTCSLILADQLHTLVNAILVCLTFAKQVPRALRYHRHCL